MSPLRVLIAAFAVLAAPLAPAHADPEIETIECTGTFPKGMVTTAGFSRWEGRLSCALGHGGYGGYAVYQTFTTPATALVVTTAVPGDTFAVHAEVVFADEARTYTLDIDDVSTQGYLAMVNPEDVVRFGSPLQYRVRGGYVRPTCGFCLADEVLGNYEVHFLAEYVYDLPVSP